MSSSPELPIPSGVRALTIEPTATADSTSDVLTRLRLAVIEGALTPGQRLVETELAEQFNASRGAIRQALLVLENERLVIRPRNRGASVRP